MDARVIMQTLDAEKGHRKSRTRKLEWWISVDYDDASARIVILTLWVCELRYVDFYHFFFIFCLCYFRQYDDVTCNGN